MKEKEDFICGHLRHLWTNSLVLLGILSAPAVGGFVASSCTILIKGKGPEPIKIIRRLPVAAELAIATSP
jgi:hypothetical protein